MRYYISAHQELKTELNDFESLFSKNNVDLKDVV